jgi:hypothetical protein
MRDKTHQNENQTKTKMKTNQKKHNKDQNKKREPSPHPPPTASPASSGQQLCWMPRNCCAPDLLGGNFELLHAEKIELVVSRSGLLL